MADFTNLRPRKIRRNVDEVTISPLEGEMPGRAEGGAKGRHGKSQLWTQRLWLSRNSRPPTVSCPRFAAIHPPFGH
ncbi:hypothetical protein [Nitratireductor soli]|uniref:hypothetical protein n=1 Tax=Nitratireductor soli TaxID=1670619 RepID=UPI0019D24A6B|nr:hypothetical protein [Nitratireductor soli]